MESTRQRARALGLAPGVLPVGARNAITDVSRVEVGHVTRIEGEDVRTGVTAILPPMYLGLQNRLYDVYAQEAAASGRKLAPGEGLGVLRDVLVCDTDEEALALWANGAAFCGAAWFAPFGFGSALNDPAQPDVRRTPQQMVEEGLLLVGSVDTVTRSLERLLADTPVRWLFAWTYNGLTPHPAIMRSLELFAGKVLPRVGVSGARSG